MPEYEIWMEGYSATGEHQKAHYIGRAFGKTFEDACRNFEYQEDFKNPNYMGERWQVEYIHRKGDKLKLDENDGGHLSIWCCMLFDNEIDARKSFG